MQGVLVSNAQRFLEKSEPFAFDLGAELRGTLSQPSKPEPRRIGTSIPGCLMLMLGSRPLVRHVHSTRFAGRKAQKGFRGVAFKPQP